MEYFTKEVSDFQTLDYNNGKNRVKRPYENPIIMLQSANLRGLDVETES